MAEDAQYDICAVVSVCSRYAQDPDRLNKRHPGHHLESSFVNDVEL